MSKAYQPPYRITSKIIHLIAQISEAVGRLSVVSDTEKSLRLRRINRIKTIQGSLAIEGNTLDEANITDILNGKRVLAPQKEIQEVRNALEVYQHFEEWQPGNEQHLLEAHKGLMRGLIDEIGTYRELLSNLVYGLSGILFILFYFVYFMLRDPINKFNHINHLSQSVMAS